MINTAQVIAKAQEMHNKICDGKPLDRRFDMAIAEQVVAEGLVVGEVIRLGSTMRFTVISVDAVSAEIMRNNTWADRGEIKPDKMADALALTLAAKVCNAASKINGSAMLAI